MNKKSEKITPLLLAAKNGNLSKLQSLLRRGSGIYERDALGRSATCLAAVNGHIPIVEWLIETKLDTLQQHPGLTIEGSLLNFASANNQVAMMAWLFQNGAKIDEPNAFGKTPLMFAAEHDHLDAVNWLLEQGAAATLGLKVWNRFDVFDIAKANEAFRVLATLNEFKNQSAEPIPQEETPVKLSSSHQQAKNSKKRNLSADDDDESQGKPKRTRGADSPTLPEFTLKQPRNCSRPVAVKPKKNSEQPCLPLLKP